MRNVLLIVGTRPEGIKMAPVFWALRKQRVFNPILVSTSQHRKLLRQALRPFALEPAVDLDIMTENQTPAQVASKVLALLPPVIAELEAEWVLVQGDTTTAMAAAAAAFYQRTRVAHVEAGLRSFRMDAPFPEEFNRKAIAVACTLHFAPTEKAKENLLREGVREEHILVVGNTIVDAVQHVLQGLPRPQPDDKRRVLVTLHRQESFGPPLFRVLGAIRKVAEKHYPAVHVTYPVHPNPNVQHAARQVLDGVPGVELVPPMDYPDFLHAFSRARVVLSDSGGVQEEAPTIGVPVLVAREVTERPEAVESGWARLVGTDPDRVLSQLEELLFDEEAWQKARGGPNPFGDGKAGEKIAAALAECSFRGRYP